VTPEFDSALISATPLRNMRRSMSCLRITSDGLYMFSAYVYRLDGVNLLITAVDVCQYIIIFEGV
jgi:hypothetical protein